MRIITKKKENNSASSMDGPYWLVEAFLCRLWRIIGIFKWTTLSL